MNRYMVPITRECKYFRSLLEKTAKYLKFSTLGECRIYVLYEEL